MKSGMYGLLAVALLAGPIAAHATLISSSTLEVWVLKHRYNVTFWQDSSGITTASQINTLPVTFDASDALRAVIKIDNKLNASPGFDFSPANDTSFFQVVFYSEPGAYGYAFCNRDYAKYCFINDFIAGYPNIGSFATFELLPSEAPEPGTFALLGLGLAGLSLSLRRSSRSSQ